MLSTQSTAGGADGPPFRRLTSSAPWPVGNAPPAVDCE
jgi:hypothetical protein